MINQIGSSASPSSPAGPTAPGGNLGKDEFLKMLVAQMRNQDPLNPMQGEQMAAQLAQFSSLEQLTNMSRGLENLTAVLGGEMLHTMHATSAMGVLGRTVLAAGDQVPLGEGGASAVTVDLGGRAAQATLRIFDANGREVGSREIGSLSAGRQSIEIGAAGEGLPAGVYHYRIDAVNAAGDPVAATTYVRARIDGVRNSANGPILTAGGMSLPFGAIVEIVAD